MVIKWFEVEKLFGAYDYAVDFESVGSNVSIIHAMNGRGKTTILNMMKATLDRDLNVGYLDSIPFKSFTVGFNDGAAMKVEKKNVFVQMLYKNNEYYRPFPITPSEEDLKKFQEWFDNMRFYVNGEYVPMPVIGNPYMVSQMGVYLDERQIFDMTELNDKRSEHTGDPYVWFVEANRLTRSMWMNDQYVDRPTIDVCQDDLQLRMNGVSNKYRDESERYDVIFPLQVMRKLASEDKEKDVLTKEEIEKKLSELNEAREEYKKLGLIDETDRSYPPRKERKYEQTTPLEELTSLLTFEMSLETRVFLTTYINNTFEKFKAFEEMAECMCILKDYVNSNSEYSDKEMIYDANDGMVFMSKLTGRKIPIHRLSSGELNNLILFYDMLFNAGDGGVVFIDEPEISLHVLWQGIVIDELLKICERNNIQGIVATHSPDIIGNHRKLLIGLKTKNRCEDDEEDNDEYGEEYDDE